MGCCADSVFRRVRPIHYQKTGDISPSCLQNLDERGLPLFGNAGIPYCVTLCRPSDWSHQHTCLAYAAHWNLVILSWWYVLVHLVDIATKIGAILVGEKRVNWSWWGACCCLATRFQELICSQWTKSVEMHMETGICTQPRGKVVHADENCPNSVNHDCRICDQHTCTTYNIGPNEKSHIKSSEWIVRCSPLIVITLHQNFWYHPVLWIAV